MRPAVVLAMAALLVPAPACASTAVVRQTDASSGYAEYVAAAGEANRLQVARKGDGVVLTDSGAVVDAGGGCTPLGPHSVSCSVEGLTVFVVNADLGDRDDSFTSAGPQFVVEGGPGNDELDGGAAPGTLSGGDGDDILTMHRFSDMSGGRGDDQLTGGDERDDLTGGPGSDTIDGGAGEDWVDYGDHRAPVTVDLSDSGSPAGAEGEADSVTNVENAEGGAGADVLTARAAGSILAPRGGSDTIAGGPGPDVINGGLGRDSIDGRGGNDLLYGSAGPDVIDAGPGDDYVESSDDTSGIRPYRRDVVSCGKGTDSVRPVGSGVPVQPLLDVIDADCETVWTATAVPNIRRLRLGDGFDALELNAPCVGRQRCLLRVAFRTGGRLAASAKREIRQHRVAKLVAPLDEAARQELAESGRLRLRLVMDVRWGRHLGNRQTSGYEVVVRRP
jgi:hypothetical protein